MSESKAYLSIYKHFFDEFLATLNPIDQLPVKVAGYSLCDNEIVGEIIDWTLQYLNQKHCPSSLITPLTKIVLDEVKTACKKQPAKCGFQKLSNSYQPLKLMQVVTRKVNEVCLRYIDDGQVSTLPPPKLECPISACAVKNTRRRMEDRHVIIEDFHTLFNIQDDSPASYYAVFDGHAGTYAAVYSVCHLHQFLAESPFYPTDPVQAFKEAFLKTNFHFLEKSNIENLSSGTTALCALLRPQERKLYVAWLGDSQALLVRQEEAIQLVLPHKPDREDERHRIEEMGGCVWFWGTWRVNGQLAVSRAIGDLEYKPYVTAEPDVKTVTLNGSEDFLILGCDGLWDFVSENEVLYAIYQQIRDAPGDLAAVSEVLVQLSKRQGSTDNISVIVVFLTDPERIASRVLDDPALWERLKNGSAQDMADQNNGIDDPKSGLMLDLDIPASFKQNGTTTVSDMFFMQRGASNGKGGDYSAEGEEDDDDLGPETDVDAVDDVLLSPAIAAAKALAAASNTNPFKTDKNSDLEVQRSQLRDFDEPAVKPRGETPTPPADTVCVGGEVENVGDSGEDSEDEWNYYKVEPSGEAVQDISKTSSHTVGSQPSTAEEDMESQLNPNAAEFVPSPTLTMPSMEEVLLSESPCKTGAPRDVSDPSSQREFTCEARTRPGELLNVESNFILNTTDNSSVSSAKTNFSNPFSVSDSELKFQEKISFPESSFYSATENSSKEIDLSKDDFNEILKVDETQFQDNLALSNLPSVKSNFHTLEPDSFETTPFKAPVEPIHVSFELQKELAPEMERSPERVHLDSEETAVFQEFDKIVSSSHIEEDNIEQDLEIEPIVSSSHVQKDNIEQEIEPPISVLHELSPIPETSVITDCNTSHQSENVSPVDIWDQTLSPVENSLILGVTSLDPITTSPLPSASATESQSLVQDVKLVSFNLEPSMKVEMQSSLDTCLSSQQTDVDLITSPSSVNVSMDMFDVNSPSEGGEGDMPDVLDPSHPQEPLHTLEQEEAINLTSPQDQCTYPLVQDQLLAERKDEEIPVLLDLSPSAPPRENDQPNVITNLNLVDIVEQLGENIVGSDVIPASNSVLGTLNFEPSLLNTLENKASVEEQELLKSPDYEKLIEEESSPQEIAPELLEAVSTPDQVIKEELVLLSQVDPDKQIEAVEKLAGESAVDKAPATEDTLAIKTAVAGIVTASAAGAALALDKPTSEEKKNVSKKPALGKDKKPGFGDKAKSAPMRSSKNTTITTTLAPVKSTPASPTKPLTSPVVKKQTGSLVTSRVGKTSPVTTSVPIKSKLSSNKPSTLLSKTTVGSSKPRPLSASPTKPTSTEKKPSLTNGEAVKPMVTKVPAPVAAKRLVSTTTKTATTKALSSTISRTSVTTSARQTTTTNSRTSTVSSPTARPKTAPVNGVPSKPRVPVSTVAFRAKQPVTNKQVKETANKQISSTRTSSLTTTTTKAPISANRTTTTTLRRLPGGVSKTTSVKETSVGQKLILGPDKTGLDSKEVVTVEHTTMETKVDPTPPVVTTESIIQPIDQD